MTIRKSKVTRRDEEESKIHEEKDQDVRDVAGERCDQEREDEDRPDDHEESNRVVVLGYIVAVGLGDAKGGREEGAVAGVEETYDKQSVIVVGDFSKHDSIPKALKTVYAKPFPTDSSH